MTYTDKNIPIECPECGCLEEGKDAMLSHVIDFHNYSPEEAVQRVDDWAEAVHEKQDDWNYNQLSAGQKRAYRADQHGR